MVGQARFADINKNLNARLDEKKILVAVHRGVWGGNIIENTTHCFQAALDMGADMFEVDLSTSTDGVTYAFHDGGERRLLKKMKNIKTMSSKTIDKLTYFNCLGEPSHWHVQRFEEVLAHFTNGELFNVDRSWFDLEAMEAVMRKYPHAQYQAIIKTPVKDEYLEFFQNCPVKYMYMPICYNMDEVRKVLTYTDINVVGVEAIAPSVDCDMFDAENIRWMKEQGLYVWINTITLSSKKSHILCAGYDDNAALTGDPDAAWGVLLEQGFNVLQTDWPAQMSSYLRKKLG